MLIILLLIFLNIFHKNNADESLIVQLPAGKIRGHVLKSGNGNSFYAFQEIPYAAPPVGRDRFQLPKDPKPWSDVLNTTKNTVVCYQKLVNYTNLRNSEDCLYINVYSPVPPGTSKLLPVLVYIHGGGFTLQAGTIEYYGPKFIMDHEVVVVAFNYRLGAFGYLTTNDDVIPPNLGMKDQLKALEWVHDHIELFGGNKSHVTIAGDSVGSMSVGLHLLGPWVNNKVLFHAAIMQSGSMLYNTRGNQAKQAALRIGKALDSKFSSTDSKELLKVLQKASAVDILAANSTGAAWPIVERDGPFKYQTFDCLTDGNIKKVPVVMGFTSEEWLRDVYRNNLKDLAARLDESPANLIDGQFNLTAENRTIAGTLLKKMYTNTTFVSNIGAYIRFDSDNAMTSRIIKQALLQSKYANIYLYQFAYKGELGMLMYIPIIPGTERVAHTEDLKYMWDDQTNSDLSKFPAQDRLMAQRYMKLWMNFIKYHNPTPTKDTLLQNVVWSKVDPKQPDNIQYLNINSPLEMRVNPRQYQDVKKIYDYYISPKDII